MKKILELEALRGFAALYVFLHHTLFSFGIIDKNSILGHTFSFGQEAVMVFFLLSGYVIAMSMMRRDYNFREYFKHRFLRIYSVVVIAWIVSYLSFLFINKDIDVSIRDIFVNIMMLQDISALKPGVFANPLFGNSPLWSLSYEWWFYMIFFLHYMLYKKYYGNKLFYFNMIALLISFVGLITFKLEYNQVSLIGMYYYIWFSGAIVLLALEQEQLNNRIVLMITIGYIALITIYIILFVIDSSAKGLGVHPLLELRHYSVSFLSITVALSFYKYLYKSLKNNYIYTVIVKIFASLAPVSFGIYVLHYPIKSYFMQFFEINRYVLLLTTFLITVIFSYIVEIKIYGYIRKKYA